MSGPAFEDAGRLIAGTSRVGAVLASFDQLAASFGPPHSQGPGLDRITAEWRIRTRAGILTIYDRTAWPDGDGTTPRGPGWWDLGSHAHECTDRALHPVVALVHEVTGCPVRDVRPWQCRPDGRLPRLG